MIELQSVSVSGVSANNIMFDKEGCIFIQNLEIARDIEYTENTERENQLIKLLKFNLSIDKEVLISKNKKGDNVLPVEIKNFRRVKKKIYLYLPDKTHVFCCKQSADSYKLFLQQLREYFYNNKPMDYITRIDFDFKLDNFKLFGFYEKKEGEYDDVFIVTDFLKQGDIQTSHYKTLTKPQDSKIDCGKIDLSLCTNNIDLKKWSGLTYYGIKQTVHYFQWNKKCVIHNPTTLLLYLFPTQQREFMVVEKNDKTKMARRTNISNFIETMSGNVGFYGYELEEDVSDYIIEWVDTPDAIHDEPVQFMLGSFMIV